MAKDNELVIKINGNIKGYTKALKAASRETEDLQKTLNTIAKTGAIAFAGFGAAILFAAKSAGEFETIEAQFETLTGSVEEAQEVIKELSDFAARTPFQFQGIAQSAKQLIAFGITGDKLIPTLTKIGDVSAATGAAFKDLTLIFGQVKAAGKLTGERLLQLEERAIPIGPALAKTMGVAETAIRDLVSKGEVDFKTFEKAFASLNQKGGLAFEGMEKRSKTFEGVLSTLGDNFDLVVAAVGENFLPILKELAVVLTNVLGFIRKNPGLTDFIAKMLVAGTATGALLTTVGLGATILLKLRASMIASSLATKSLSFAIKGLIGSTGLGLLVAFLPEIIDMFQSVFGEATKIVERETELQNQAIKNQRKVLKAERDGMSKTELIYLRNRLDRQRAFEEASLRAEKNRGDKSISEFRKQRDLEFEVIELKFAKRLKAELAAAETTKKIEKETFDKKSQRLKDENALIEAHLAGIEKEEIAFLKKQQAIDQKTRDAAIIQDEKRRELALKNVKLLSDQIIKEKEDLAKRRAKLQSEKEENDFEALVAEIELQNKALDAESDREQKQKENQAAEEARRQERIAKLKNENEIIKAGLQELDDEEVAFLRRRQEIRDQTRDAEKVANEEEKNITLENIRLKNEELLAEEAEFFTKRDELRAEQEEAEMAVKEELDALSEEKRKALQKSEIDDLTKSFETKEKIRSKAIKKELLDKRKENALFEAEEEKHGLIIANFRAFNRKEEFLNAQTAVGQLAQLQRSGNSTMKTIGKAAAIVQIGINTQKGAIAAYSSLAGIPIVGPALGIAAAAALTAFGIERAAQVQSAQAGGIVAGTGFGDRVPFLLEPGELITPRQNFEEVISAVADQRVDQREAEEAPEEEGFMARVDIGFDGEEAADVLTVRQNEQRFLGISQTI